MKYKLTKKRTEICESLNLYSVEDVLSYYPYKYENYQITPYRDFSEGSQVVFEGELITAPSTFRYGYRSITRFRVLYEEEELLITIFNRPWAKSLNINDKITIIGKYEGKNKVTALNYYTKPINEVIGILPFYSLKEGISQKDIRKIIETVYQNNILSLSDKLPSDLKDSHHLISYQEAIYNIHFPSNKNSLQLALSRLKYEEFLKFYVALDIMSNNNESIIREPKKFDNNKVEEFINSFGFEFTLDQRNCVNEILNDLSSNKPMYRLVQGEVGSGKTAISMVGLYANYLAGYTGAIMAPTEILAKQHFSSFKKAFEILGVRIGVLYSSMDNLKVEKERIKNGEYDIVIGTHALFQEDIEFNNLGMVICDEQHRFGVNQRKALKGKGNNVDFILMSATPIPRTLASSIYGDMDISSIETLPTGRKEVKTILITNNSIVDIIDELKDNLIKGKQMYIIASAIEQSDNYNAKDITNLYNSLIDVLSPYKLSLLHGKMTTEEKDQIMNDFNDNKIQVLISTTVVEVGVNVPNATVMVIYDADRFGLSQLHQLRGRIRRGNDEGTCYLLTNTKDADTLKRLKVLVDTNDGFKISYEDLKLRGPGDILGTRQSGLPAFILGDLFTDNKFIEAAKKDAKKIVNNLDNLEYKKYYDDILQVANSKYVD